MGAARKEYADIIDLKHPVSKKHPQMSRLNRAAQFSPFAALTGYDDLVEEAARYTGQKRELDEEEKEQLNQKLILLFSQTTSCEALFTYFQPDTLKHGGKYVTVAGRIIRHNSLSHSITLDNGDEIYIDDIVKIDSTIFQDEAL